MALVFDDVEVEHRSVACWQLSHHLVDHLWRYVPDGRVVVVGQFRDVIVPRREFVPFVVANESESLVDDDSRRPNLERALPLISEFCTVCYDSDERILEHVLCIVFVRYIPQADSLQVGCILGIELLHRPVIPVAK